jgi:hypothetical protein
MVTMVTMVTISFGDVWIVGDRGYGLIGVLHFEPQELKLLKTQDLD